MAWMFACEFLRWRGKWPHTERVTEDAEKIVLLENARSDAHCVRCAGCNTLPQERLERKRLSKSQRNSRH